MGSRSIAVLLPLALACAAPAELPAGAPEHTAGKPIGRAKRLISGEWSYSLNGVKRHDSGVRVDLLLRNGTHRHYDQLMLRVTVLGAEQERRSARTATGGLRDGQSRRLSARINEVPFPVEEVLVELLYALP